MHITDALPGEARSKLVFGMEWRAYQAKGKSHVRGQYAEDFSASHYVEMEAGEAANGGFCALDADDLKDAVLYSGAARVASLEHVKSKPAALVLIPDNERVYLVYVVKGAVHNDEVLKPAQVNERRAEIIEQAGKQGFVPVVMVSGGYAQEHDQEFDAADLLTLKKVGRIKRVPAGIPNAVVYVAFIGIVGLAVKIGFGALAPQSITAQGPTWAQQYATAVRHTFSGAMPQARLLAPQTLILFDSRDSNTNGWQYNHADCKATGSCTLAYDRMGGTFEEFVRAAPPSMYPITFAQNGMALTANGPTVPKVASVSPAQQKDWPSEQQMIERLQTPAQRMSQKPTDLKDIGYSARIGAARPILTGPQPANQRHVPVIREGEWEIDGYRWQSALLDDLPSNMTLDTLNIALDQHAPAETGGVGIRFTAKGKYYVVQ
jgi:hypothetical protein